MVIVVVIVGTALDRTQEEAARIQLQEKTRLLQLILDCMGEGVVVTDPHDPFAAAGSSRCR